MEMSENNNKTETRRPDTQSDRWLKYGSNVVLSIVLVIGLAVGVTMLGQHASARMDMTGGSLSLKPQTVNIVNGLKQKVTLVSLYARPDNAPDQAAQAQRVSDLFDEYKNKSTNIDVRVIDPAKEKDKLEELHQEFISRYGSQIKNYKDYLEDWKSKFDQIKKMIDAEGKAITPFAPTEEPEFGEGEVTRNTQFVRSITRTIMEVLPDRIAEARKAVDHELKKKHPDFKAAASTAKEQMEQISQLAGALAEQVPAVQEAKDFKPEFKKYWVDSEKNYRKIKQMADESIAQHAKLGELKVDQLEQALNVENPILVLGESEWRILSQRQVWQDDTDLRAISASGKVKPRFAGEQQITTAIYALENPKKQKVCFIRGSGPPFTQQGFPPFMPSGQLFMFADRLREYNFDVSEKDLSGRWAMQAQMQQMPSAPEPSDEQIKDAIWIVIDLPQGGDQNQPMPPSTLGPKLKEHLDHGGSALILADIHGENVNDALASWGVTVHPDKVAFHDTIKLNESADSDPLEEAKARPYIWDIRDYGDHPLAAAIKNLDSFFLAPVAVSTPGAKGCTITPLLPLTANMPGLQTWGKANLDDMERETPAFHPERGDMPPPIFAGAVVEKQGAGRLVVIGSVRALTNGFVRIYDPRLARRDPPIRVNRSPGNLELGSNSVFWLAHLEPMIAISPAAMDVSRIGDMSNSMLNFWRIGVLLILLPGLVLAGGTMMYFARRD
jgi:hypothetical protein